MSGTGIFAREFDRLDSIVQIGVANGRVISLTFPDTPEPGAGSEHEILDWIERYLGGAETDVTNIGTGLTVPTDQRVVLETVRKIPYGEELAFDRVVARSPGLDPEDSAAVAAAERGLAENPIPLAVPDHRVPDRAGATPERIASILREIEGL